MKEQVWFTVKFYSAVKRGKLTRAATWVKSQDVLSETSQPLGTDAGTPLYRGTEGRQFTETEGNGSYYPLSDICGQPHVDHPTSISQVLGLKMCTSGKTTPLNGFITS